MNQIVRKVVPVSSLPAELRAEFDPAGQVEIVGEAPIAFADNLPLTRILDELRDQRVFEGDPVARIRALRDEWDDRDERIRSDDD